MKKNIIIVAVSIVGLSVGFNFGIFLQQTKPELVKSFQIKTYTTHRI